VISFKSSKSSLINSTLSGASSVIVSQTDLEILVSIARSVIPSKTQLFATMEEFAGEYNLG
jgi:hypothetical protein